MMSRAFFAKSAAVALALAIHGAAMMQFSSKMTVEMDSSAGAAQAMIGSSFEDMSVGTLAATQTEELTETVEPEPDTTPPTELTRTEPPEPTPPVETPPLEAIKPPAEATPLAEQTPLETPAPDALALTPTVTQAKPPEPQPLAPPKPKPETLKPVKQVETVKAAQPEPEKTVKAVEPVKPPKKPVVKKPVKAKPKAAPKGNAKQNNTKGSATGTQAAKAKTQGTKTGKATASGNAAVSNYPGKVMRKISRVSRPRSTTRGSVVVAFTIASSGGLSGLSVAKSSGNAKLDQLALGVIRKAAPFPKPPAGARRSFSITIKGR